MYGCVCVTVGFCVCVCVHCFLSQNLVIYNKSKIAIHYLRNCLVNVSANLNMACSEESLKHSELALLEAELSWTDAPSNWRWPRLGGVADLGEGRPLR